MIRYRLYTEDKDRESIISLAKQVSDGFTVLDAKGFWQGIAEGSLVLEFLGTKKLYRKVRALATAIKLQNRQDAVMLTAESIHGGLI